MAETYQLVKRLLETPDIARAVPRLAPEVLHRVIERCGLEDCAELVALATPRQIERVLDLDLWRAPSPGADESLDAGRFGAWLEVLRQSGPSVAGDMLAGIDLDLIVGGLMEHVRVFDAVAVGAYTTLDGELVEGRAAGDTLSCEIGGYLVEARRPDAWDAIVEVLAHLSEERPAFFHRAMRASVGVSDGAREADGFHDLLDRSDQHRADLALDREARRDRQGYVAPGQARAFLEAARSLHLDGGQPSIDPVARACLRDLALDPIGDAQAAAADGPSAPGVSASPADGQAVHAVMDILAESGVVARPRALLTAGEEHSRLALVHAFVETHMTAMEELAFLANALVAGCGVQDRAFTPQEASDAVLATCNLGLENWPPGWPSRDLVTTFQVGWAVLHRDVGRHAAAALIDVLADVDWSDREVQWALQTLRRELTQHLRNAEPWLARPALDALLMIDATAWAVLRAMLDACPAMHETLAGSAPSRLRIDPDRVTFIARNSDVARVHEYVASLAVTLGS